jgi:lincosamide nucleotidyltransferase A/C/D/E
MHVVVFDEKRNGILGPVENGSVYPANSLSGTGTIAGQKVRCVSAEYMVKFISPWLHKLRDKDFQDVLALCEKFGIEYPEEYFRFKKSN